MANFGPASGRFWYDLKPRYRRDAQEFLDLIGRQNDIHILRDPADKTMAPHGPTSAQDRFRIYRLQQVIHGLYYPAVPTRQVLRTKHRLPRGQQLIGQFQLLRQKSQAYGSHTV